MMKGCKIFSAEQIRKADAYTITHLPIASVDLMEKAASACVEWIGRHSDPSAAFRIFCGPGNNGGDGLAIGRLLHQKGFKTEIHLLRFSDNYSDDFKINEQRLKEISPGLIHDLRSVSDLPAIDPKEIVIDAIFGSGLTRSVSGLALSCIRHINESGAKVISVDVPSGLFADKHSGNAEGIVQADVTLSFQLPKLAFMFAENADHTGDWKLLDIGLSGEFISGEPSSMFYIGAEEIRSIVKPRKKFSHKGSFGHALLIAGSYGKMGAAVLAVKSCLRSGAGLVTAHVPGCGYGIMQSSAAEAMTSIDKNNVLWSDELKMEGYASTGIGPGIGTEAPTQESLEKLLLSFKGKLVLDADALNILSMNRSWLGHLPAGTILTPHVKELERLTKKANNDFDRHDLQVGFSKQYKVFVILKGANTCITDPEGNSYFNSTGNPGMAKGGSGDVLTGVLTGLLARGYDPLEAALLGVYLHGLSGDLAKEEKGEESMTAGDLIECLPGAFKLIERDAGV